MENFSRDEILDDYYNKYFVTLCNSGVNGKGSEYFHKLIEAHWKSHSPENILEVGAGSGQHLFFLNDITFKRLQQYTLLDIREDSKGITTNINKLSNFYLDFSKEKFKFLKGSVENIPSEAAKFDRVTSTCLFHHIEDPLLGFQEIRRVLKMGGEAVIGLPTDPGVLNRMVKYFITYRVAKKIGIKNPRFIYALEHQNHVGALLELAREVFKNDDLEVHYKPFFIPSWNFNLAVVIKVTKNAD